MATKKKELESKADAEKGGRLIPAAKVPKGIETLARRMKEAEIARKHHASIEGEAREQLCGKMIAENLHRFQIEVDGQDYEFEREELSKVKSKKLDTED